MRSIITKILQVAIWQGDSLKLYLALGNVGYAVLPWRSLHGEIIALGLALIIGSEFLRRFLKRFTGPSATAPFQGRAKRWLELGFATFTFPFVLLIYVVAALWLLPYVLLSKPYRLHLKEARRKQKEEGWTASPFSRQLASIDVTDFLTMPFKPIFSFMDWVERRPTARPIRRLKVEKPLKDERA